MSGYRKFFLYAMATGIEKLGDSKAALKYIDDILQTPEEQLWIELQQAIEQRHRLKIFEHYGISMEIGSPIDIKGLPDTIIQELLGTVVSMHDLKRLMNKQIESRGQIQGDTREQD